ncbi:hypothetical protein TNCV_57751 [Trichonephila clavipes]|nr:hypothetical protein TNCV_57751 [Trichonephila clavipes]
MGEPPENLSRLQVLQLEWYGSLERGVPAEMSSSSLEIHHRISLKDYKFPERELMKRGKCPLINPREPSVLSNKDQGRKVVSK